MGHTVPAPINADFTDTSPVPIPSALDLHLKYIYSCQILQTADKKLHLNSGQQQKYKFQIKFIG